MYFSLQHESSIRLDAPGLTLSTLHHHMPSAASFAVRDQLHLCSDECQAAHLSSWGMCARSRCVSARQDDMSQISDTCVRLASTSSHFLVYRLVTSVTPSLEKAITYDSFLPQPDCTQTAAI